MADDNGPSQSLRCDGTPHPPTATPPLPFHDWRWDGDDPYIVCGRCAQMQDSRSGRVIRQGARNGEVWDHGGGHFFATEEGAQRLATGDYDAQVVLAQLRPAVAPEPRARARDLEVPRG